MTTNTSHHANKPCADLLDHSATRARRRATATAIALLTAGLLLVAGSAQAAGSPSVSPFSPATAKCIKQAAATLKTCSASMPVPDCKAAYGIAYAACFAPGAGVVCATDCRAALGTCQNPAQKAQKTCVVACGAVKSASLKLCDVST